MTTAAQEDRGRASTSFCLRRRRSCCRTFDLQGSYTARGRPMTTGSQEVMIVNELQLRFAGEEEKDLTVDELQLHFAGGGGGVVGDPQGLYTMRGRPMTTGYQEVMTADELQLRFAGGGFVGGPLTFRGRHPMTTGVEEVTTVDELQLCFAGVVGGTLTLTFDSQGSYTGMGHPR